jgi:hypothetical protein
MLYRKNLPFVMLFAALVVLSFSLLSPLVSPLVNANEVQTNQSDSEIIQTVKNYGLQPGQTSDVQVTRIISSGEYALVELRIGDGGGQSALIKKNGQWTVVGAGGGAMDQRNLVEYGFPPDIAQKMIQTYNQPPSNKK